MPAKLIQIKKKRGGRGPLLDGIPDTPVRSRKLFSIRRLTVHFQQGICARVGVRARINPNRLTAPRARWPGCMITLARCVKSISASDGVSGIHRGAAAAARFLYLYEFCVA